MVDVIWFRTNPKTGTKIPIGNSNFMEGTLFQEIRNVARVRAHDLRLLEYDPIFQNAVMSMGFRILSESVDSANREYELSYLTKVFTPDIADSYFGNVRNHLWVLCEGSVKATPSTAYGYIGVTTKHGVGHLNGFYLEPFLRGTGVAKTMLDTALEFCRSQACTSVEAEVAHYSHAALAFYKKHDFVHKQTTMENDGRLTILHYVLKL